MECFSHVTRSFAPKCYSWVENGVVSEAGKETLDFCLCRMIKQYSSCRFPFPHLNTHTNDHIYTESSIIKWLFYFLCADKAQWDCLALEKEDMLCSLNNLWKPIKLKPGLLQRGQWFHVPVHFPFCSPNLVLAFILLKFSELLNSAY